MNQTMSDDIPQDQVEAVARALCDYECRDAAKSGEPCCIDDPVRQSRDQECDDRIKLATIAIRVLTPMIAAVERERCAAIADGETEICCGVSVGDWSDCALKIAESIRAQPGTVTTLQVTE